LGYCKTRHNRILYARPQGFKNLEVFFLRQFYRINSLKKFVTVTFFFIFKLFSQIILEPQNLTLMAQRKKKANTNHQQKVAMAQQKNEYLRRFRFILNCLAGFDAYSLFSKKEIEKEYILRAHSLKIIAAENHAIPAQLIQDIRPILSFWVKKEPFQLLPNSLEISLDEFFTFGITIFGLETLLNDEQPNSRKIKIALNEYFRTFNELLARANEKLLMLLYVYSIEISDINRSLYWFSHSFSLSRNYNGVDNVISVYSYKLNSIQININDNVRQAVRFGWINFDGKGPFLISIKPSVLNISSHFANIPLDVYFQQHAIDRLFERIDCISKGIVYSWVLLSLYTPRVSYDTNNNLLIEFNILGTKAGYFRVDIVEGILLVRTFLFITNNTTPEGLLLERTTGLQKLDKKYLAIDKLSTFMTSEISNSTEICHVLDNAGCLCLIDLHDKVKEICQNNPSKSTIMAMQNFLQKNKAYAHDISIPEESTTI
jgi:hypothetical protein